MNRRILILALALLVGGGLWWTVHARRVRAAAASVPPATDRQSVQLTVYAQDFGLVREVRPLALTAGVNRLSLLDVSRKLDPESVLLRWQGAGAALPQLRAHAYDIGVGDGDGLLKRYLGKPVDLVRYDTNGHESERQTGTLMNDSGGQVVLQSDGKFYVNPPGTIVASAESGIVTIPQLSVQADSPAAQTAPLEVAYLTRGLSWSSDYVGTLAPGDGALSLECWATVTNRTGTDYPNADVTLIAGSPNRAAQTPESYGGYPGGNDQVEYAAHARMPVPRPMNAPNLVGGAPTTAGDFHAYRIARPTTVMQEQMNRLLLLSSARVPIRRDYSATPPALSPWDDGVEYETVGGIPRRGDVVSSLTFFNKAADGLGAPLPAGTLRLYEPDASGALRYAGAAGIADTPHDQKITVTLANAFDVFTEWRLLKSQKLNKHTQRKQAELVLHNEKSTPVTLRIVQNLGERWKVVTEPLKHVNLNSSRVQWTVPIPAHGQVPFRFTVDFTV